MFKLRLLFLLVTLSNLYSTSSWSQCTPNQVIEAVTNGDFEQGYMTGDGSKGVNSDLTYAGNFTPLGTCHYSIANQYGVGKAESSANMSNCTANPRQTYLGPDYINIAGGFNDHTPGLSGNGYALIGDFEGYTGGKWDASGLPAIWRQQVTVQANQKYYFSAWFANYNRDASLAGYATPTLNFVVVPMIGATPQYANRVVLGTATPTGQMNWQQFSGTWTPPASPTYTSVMLLIEVQAANASNTNDLAIDDISFINGCDNLTSLPAAYVPDLGADFSLCVTGSPKTVDSNVPTGGTQYWWYSGTGTIQTTLINGTTTDKTYPITTPGTYRVCVQNASFPGGCSASSTVVVTNTMPAVTLADQNICTASTVTLTALLPSGATYSGTGLTYAWTRPAGAPASVNSPTYSTGVTGTYSVTVTPSAGAIAAGCTAVTSNNATVTTSLVTPSFVSGDCSSATKSFTLSSTAGSGNTYGWYDAATGGNLKATGNPGTVTYTAAQVPTTVYLENYSTTTAGALRTAALQNGAGGSDRQETRFTALQNFTLVSFYVRSAASTGTVTVSLTKDGSAVAGSTATVTSSTTAWTPITVNWPIVAGSTYVINISGGGWLQMQDPYSSTTYGGLVTVNPNAYTTSGSAIEWTVRTTSACIRSPFTIDCALPVEFLNFDALRSGNNVDLDWATASEFDAKSFIIERSLNGTDYSAIGEVEASNNANGAVYGFVDRNAPHANLYYRLRQVDINGTSTYSIIRYVTFVPLGGLIVVPNPAQDVVNIVLPAGSSDVLNASVQLYSTLGQVIYFHTVSTHQLSQGWNLDLTDFAKGTYIVKVTTTEGQWIEKLIKE